MFIFLKRSDTKTLNVFFRMNQCININMNICFLPFKQIVPKKFHIKYFIYCHFLKDWQIVK